jgi:hypothetical protein
MNDASGLQPAFELAARYRLGLVALDGVTAGLDPALWRMVTSFRNDGSVSSRTAGYQLSWQVLDQSGKVVREARLPLGEARITFLAPGEEGRYQLAVGIVDAEGALVAPETRRPVEVAPPPPPTPTPTTGFVIDPVPGDYPTRAPPPDEVDISRPPVKVSAVPPELDVEADASLRVAEAVVRSGPGVRFDELTGVRSGELFTLLARDSSGSWLRVRLVKTGLEGWILAEFLALNLDPDELPVEEPATPTPAS